LRISRINERKRSVKKIEERGGGRGEGKEKLDLTAFNN